MENNKVLIDIDMYARLVIAEHDFEIVKNVIASQEESYIKPDAVMLLRELCGIEKGENNQ